jgi:hypothetical protein
MNNKVTDTICDHLRYRILTSLFTGYDNRTPKHETTGRTTWMLSLSNSHAYKLQAAVAA